jgi:hypothetical protein
LIGALLVLGQRLLELLQRRRQLLLLRARLLQLLVQRVQVEAHFFELILEVPHALLGELQIPRGARALLLLRPVLLVQLAILRELGLPLVLRVPAARHPGRERAERDYENHAREA